jgi:hypothetical protein
MLLRMDLSHTRLNVQCARGWFRFAGATRWPCSVVVALGISLCGAVGAEERYEKYYEKHIIAVDKDGAAMWPRVRHWTDGKNPDGSPKHQFKAQPKRMDGELLEGEIERQPNGKLKLRQEYYEYISTIVEDIRKKKPKRVVFYIHGGMNFITGAIEKGAQLAEDVRGRESEEYRISICWSSNLFSTYGEHLFSNYEGLRSPGLGLLTSPLTLLSDVGGAVADAPRSLVRMFDSQLHAVRPTWFKRDRHAYIRELELEKKPGLGMKPTLSASMGADERVPRRDAVAADAIAWTVTLPLKVSTVPIIDSLGTGAWQMMLRRTRTMFERETSIITRYLERHENEKPLRKVQVDETNRPAGEMLSNGESEIVRAIEENEQVYYAGRLGAVRLFFDRMQEALMQWKTPATDQKVYRPSLVIVGHSMGTIVTNEILARFDGIDFDHIVYMAAACSLNDFGRIGVPYLQRHPESHFYNICLQPTAERAEAQPGRVMIFDPWYFPLEIAPRGSLLVWIDSYFDHPESEGDRTLGRWENAVLASDAVPKSIVHRVTLKAFGRERRKMTIVPGDDSEPGMPMEGSYTAPPGRRTVQSGGLNRREYLAEPQQHGDFSRFRMPENRKKPNYAFTKERYWKAERNVATKTGKREEATRRAVEKLRK